MERRPANHYSKNNMGRGGERNGLSLKRPDEKAARTPITAADRIAHIALDKRAARLAKDREISANVKKILANRDRSDAARMVGVNPKFVPDHLKPLVPKIVSEIPVPVETFGIQPVTTTSTLKDEATPDDSKQKVKYPKSHPWLSALDKARATLACAVIGAGSAAVTVGMAQEAVASSVDSAQVTASANNEIRNFNFSTPQKGSIVFESPVARASASKSVDKKCLSNPKKKAEYKKEQIDEGNLKTNLRAKERELNKLKAKEKSRKKSGRKLSSPDRTREKDLQIKIKHLNYELGLVDGKLKNPCAPSKKKNPAPKTPVNPQPTQPQPPAEPTPPPAPTPPTSPLEMGQTCFKDNFIGPTGTLPNPQIWNYDTVSWNGEPVQLQAGNPNSMSETPQGLAVRVLPGNPPIASKIDSVPLGPVGIFQTRFRVSQGTILYYTVYQDGTLGGWPGHGEVGTEGLNWVAQQDIQTLGSYWRVGGGVYAPLKNDDGQYHTYTIIITKTELTGYMDGKPTGLSKKNDGNPADYPFADPNNPLQIKITASLLPGQTISQIQEMDVAFVSFSSLPGEPCPQTFENIGTNNMFLVK